MNKQQLIQSINNKYSEYFEMEGEKSPSLMIDILAGLLIKERATVEYYKKLNESKQQYQALNS